MLSAFTARPIVELKPKERGRIESLLSYGKSTTVRESIPNPTGDRLLVGLSTGALRVYRINELNADVSRAQLERPPSQPLSETAELAEEHDKFAKYKVEQLALIKEANILVVLAGAVVIVYDLKSYELQDTLVKTKGRLALLLVQGTC
jgi:Vam6/Vps39-like protein vacuolar protein sorting-associated protein 39